MTASMVGDEPLCPWCGEMVTDSPDDDLDHCPGDQMIECAECGGMVVCRVSCVVTYETRQCAALHATARRRKEDV